MRVYQTFDKKNHEGKYYKEWDLPDGFPIPQGYIFIPPTEGLNNPKFNIETNRWEESKDDLLDGIILDSTDMKENVSALKQEILEARQRAEMTEEALLDLASMLINL